MPGLFLSVATRIGESCIGDAPFYLLFVSNQKGSLLVRFGVGTSRFLPELSFTPWL